MVLARCLDVQLMMRPLINHSRKSDETINKSFKKEHFIQEKNYTSSCTFGASPYIGSSP
jgi:hypothetical protein